MLGGYQIIDLRSIGLELKGTQQTINDAGILKQLRGLRDYIEKGHDYTKALTNSLKPILIRYRDAKNNEKREVSSFASIVSENSSLTIVIESKNLQIEVVFEEKTDEVGNKYYDIKTAKYLYSVNEVIDGDLKVKGDLEVEGDLVISPDSGTIADVLGLDSEGNLVKGTISGGTKLYKHKVNFTRSGSPVSLIIFTADGDPITYSAGGQGSPSHILTIKKPICIYSSPNSDDTYQYINYMFNSTGQTDKYSIQCVQIKISDNTISNYNINLLSWMNVTGISSDEVTEL